MTMVPATKPNNNYVPHVKHKLYLQICCLFLIRAEPLFCPSAKVVNGNQSI